MQLVEAAPGGTARLCEQLEPGPAQRRCVSVQERPHLRFELPAGELEGGRSGGGPTTRHSLPADHVVSPLADVPPLTAQCDDTHDPNSCQGSRAQQRALQGDVAAVAGLCAAMSEPRWREECLFSAAETIVDSLGAEGYAGASDLCLGSGRFASNCQFHLIIHLAARLPVGEPAPGGWEAAIAIAGVVQQRWRDLEPDFGAVVHQRFWAEVTFRAFLERETLSGELLDVLPIEAAPHVRAAVAWRLLRLERGEMLSLEDWVVRLTEALAARQEVEAPNTRAPLYIEVDDLWGWDREDDAQVPALPYLTSARRAVSLDLEEDLTICVLEAVARHAKQADSVLLDGTSSAYPLAAWTAERLLVSKPARRPGGLGDGKQPAPSKRGRPGQGRGPAWTR